MRADDYDMTIHYLLIKHLSCKCVIRLLSIKIDKIYGQKRTRPILNKTVFRISSIYSFDFPEKNLMF